MPKYVIGAGQWMARIVIVVMAAVVLQPASAAAQIAYAVTQSNTLIKFDVRAPGAVTTIGPITTFQTPGVQILAIDFRPADGRLFGLGSDHQLYELNTVTADAIDTNLTAVPGVPFTGSIGVDFDPMPGPFPFTPPDSVGSLQVLTDTGDNRRVFESGAQFIGTTLSPSSDISAIAFSRPHVGTERRTLFGIDHGSNSLVRIGNADAFDDGTSMLEGGVHVIGPLYMDPAEDIGFDISANDGIAYAVMGAAGDPQSTLYQINLWSGEAAPVGVVGVPERVRALSVFSRSVTVYLLTTTRQLVTVKSGVPETVVKTVNLSPGPDTILRIDARPATGDLYGLTNAGHLVIINPVTGLVRQVATISGVTINGTPLGFDFNPLTDRAHIVTSSGQHVSVNPDTGAAVVEPLTGSAGVVSIAFSNNRADASATTLYALIPGNRFGRIDNLTTTGNFVDIGPTHIGFDPPSSLDVSGVDGAIFLGIRSNASSQMTLCVVDPAVGSLTITGFLPATVAVEDFAIASPGRIRLATPNFFIPEPSAGENRAVVIERVGDVVEPVSVSLQRVDAGSTATLADGGIPTWWTVHFTSGERFKTVPASGSDDALEEGDETVNMALRAPEGGATLATPSTGVVTIVDDDVPLPASGKPRVQISTGGQRVVAATTSYLAVSGRVDDQDGVLNFNPIAEVRWENDRGFNGVASSFGLREEPGSNHDSVPFAIDSVPLLPGLNVITVTAVDQQGHSSFDTIFVTLDELKYYFSEGALSTFFDTDLLLANPNTDVAPVTIDYLIQGGGKITKKSFMGASSRATIAVDDVPELAGVGEVSMVVTADAVRPLVVERTMRWGEGRYGAHTEKATDGPRYRWYFAEGSQGTFFTYVLLANPNASPIVARVTFLQEGGGNNPPFVNVDLPPFSRRTVDAGSVPRVPNSSFGMIVTFSAGPGVAERAMYFGTGPLWIGGHESAGVPTPSREWYLAEGATGSFFTTFVLLANPDDGPTNVDMTFFPADGPPVQKPRFVLPAGQRLTLNIAEQDPSLADAAVATRVVTDFPILVERAQYWPFTPDQWYEAHNSFGVTALGTRWGLAEGRVGGPEEYQTYILLANPGATDADVTITFLRETGAPLQHVVTVPAGRRFNVGVTGGAEIDLHDERFGALITSTQPIAVERAMYGNAASQIWQTGTNAVATRLP